MKTIARIETRAELLRRLSTLRPDSTARWGRMSAHQMVCHLNDSCRVALGLKEVARASTLLQRTIVKWIALYAPVPWPAGIPTLPDIDQYVGGTKPVEFAGDVAQLASLLDQIATPRRAVSPEHPILGAMSRPAWLRWAYLHTDHHLRQFGA